MRCVKNTTSLACFLAAALVFYVALEVAEALGGRTHKVNHLIFKGGAGFAARGSVHWRTRFTRCFVFCVNPLRETLAFCEGLLDRKFDLAAIAGSQMAQQDMADQRAQAIPI